MGVPVAIGVNELILKPLPAQELPVLIGGQNLDQLLKPADVASQLAYLFRQRFTLQCVLAIFHHEPGAGPTGKWEDFDLETAGLACLNRPSRHAEKINATITVHAKLAMVPV